MVVGVHSRVVGVHSRGEGARIQEEGGRSCRCRSPEGVPGSPEQGRRGNQAVGADTLQVQQEPRAVQAWASKRKARSRPCLKAKLQGISMHAPHCDAHACIWWPMPWQGPQTCGCRVAVHRVAGIWQGGMWNWDTK